MSRERVLKKGEGLNLRKGTPTKRRKRKERGKGDQGGVGGGGGGV